MKKPEPKDFPPESPHDLEWGGYNHEKYSAALDKWGQINKPITMSNKRYKLRKDLPYVKAGAIFEKCDDVTRPACRDYSYTEGDRRWWFHPSDVEGNSEWFEEIKPERIEVKYEKRNDCFVSVYYSGTIPQEVVDSIKSAIDNILNGTPTLFVDSHQKMYTQDQYNKAIEDAFNMARETADPVPEPPRIRDYFRYPTFQDYLKSLQP